ncbi:MAG: ribonuclease HII [Bdellovibrionales bacterium]
MPDFTLEQAHRGRVFGLDEVGRGPLAGPVVAACVHIPESTYGLPFVKDIRDSKTLSEKRLNALYDLITQHFIWSVAEISPQEIDRINILQASLKAMVLAFDLIDPRFRGDDNEAVLCLVDGNRLPKDLPCPAQAIVKGDAKSVSIAAASIVAKVTRDRIMHKLHQEHPQYGWKTNVGYPSKAHRAAIDTYGVTPHHRKSFAPVKNFLAYGSTRTPSISAA